MSGLPVLAAPPPTSAPAVATAPRRVAVMQPYLFPHLGYFHLAHAADVFVFYDDVHYIQRGWIHRNRLLHQGADLGFTVPVAQASQNRLIMDLQPLVDERWRRHFRRQLTQLYRKAPHFDAVAEPLLSVFDGDTGNLADLAIRSVTTVFDCLGLPFRHTRSSQLAPATRGLPRAERLVAITQALGAAHYVNAPGGRALYTKDEFRARGVELSFVESHAVEYRQFGAPFVPQLSIIDVLMFNPRPRVVELLSRYALA